MPTVTATVEISAPTPLIYNFLRNRYESDAFRNAWKTTRGYVPEYEVIEDIENKALRFRAAGREPIFKFRISSWEWRYELEALPDDKTKVTIRYEWSIFLSIMAGGTAKHQAANELGETVLALEALAFRS